MINENLIKYVVDARKLNIGDEEIKNNLLKSGWNENDINMALSNNQLPIPTPLIPGVVVGSHNMWDAFQHIIMFISLYVAATSIGLILLYYVDIWFPAVNNILGSYVNHVYGKSLLTGYYSALIVSLPVFVLLFAEISRKTKNNPVIRDLRTRKKLIYLTLIITFIIVLEKLSSIIYKFLNGNVTLNFVMHFLVIVGISGSIFVYYLGQVSQDRKI